MELVFSARTKDSTVQRWRDVTKADGTYQVVVPAGATYQIALSKDGLNLETQEYAVPQGQADTSSVIKNFYLAFHEPPDDDDYYQRRQWPTGYFDVRSAVLRPEAMRNLDTVARILRDDPRLRISIEGHADRLETPKGQSNPAQYLVHLGQARAAATLAYLRQHETPANCLETVSYGGKRPAAPDDTPDRRQLNRRIEIKPIDVEGIYVDILNSGYSDLKRKSFGIDKQFPKQTAMVRGRAFSTQDSTTVIPGMELVFRTRLADSAWPALRTLTGPDGTYQVLLSPGQTYRVTLNKDGRYVGMQQYEVPGMPVDSSGLMHNFYADYDMESMVDPLPPMLFFDVSKATLRPESKARLDNIVQMLRHNPDLGISVEGHAEPREVPRNQPNRAQYQVQLGQRRAQAAYDYLAQKGILAKQRITKSYGGTRLAAPNDNAENWQLNRRVELKSISVGDITTKRRAAKHGPPGILKPSLRLPGQKHSFNTRNEKKAPPKH
jgi:outer membrane protein OmpA-like peptidoglycan-associated protein